MLVSRMALSNPDLLSSSETWVNFGIRSGKKHLSEFSPRQKAIGGVYFIKNEDLTLFNLMVYDLPILRPVA